MFDADEFEMEVTDIGVAGFDPIVHAYEQRYKVSCEKRESLYFGPYNRGYGIRYTFSDGSAFNLILDQINPPEDDSISSEAI